MTKRLGLIEKVLKVLLYSILLVFQHFIVLESVYINLLNPRMYKMNPQGSKN